MKETPMIRGTSLQEINSRLNDCRSIFWTKKNSEANLHCFSIITTFLIHLSEQVFGNKTVGGIASNMESRVEEQQCSVEGLFHLSIFHCSIVPFIVEGLFPTMFHLSLLIQQTWINLTEDLFTYMWDADAENGQDDWERWFTFVVRLTKQRYYVNSLTSPTRSLVR